MNKIHIQSMGCFPQVAAVLGKERATAELFKAVQSQGEVYRYTDMVTDDVSRAFIWNRTPQGSDWWCDVAARVLLR